MKIIDITTANILKYVKLTNNTYIIKVTKKILNEEPKMLLKDFLSIFLNKYDITCEYFDIFYEELYNDIGLYDFYKNSFVLLL